MANKRISQLPAAGALDPTAVFPIEAADGSGATQKQTLQAVLDAAGGDPLPDPTGQDGKVLGVASGAYALQNPSGGEGAFIPLAGTDSGTYLDGFFKVNPSGITGIGAFNQEVAEGSGAYLSWEGESLNITISNGSGISKTYSFLLGGLKAGGDYSAYYTARSLVDKGYVDTQIAGVGGGIATSQYTEVDTTSSSPTINRSHLSATKQGYVISTGTNAFAINISTSAGWQDGDTIIFFNSSTTSNATLTGAVINRVSGDSTIPPLSGASLVYSTSLSTFLAY